MTTVQAGLLAFCVCIILFCPTYVPKVMKLLYKEYQDPLLEWYWQMVLIIELAIPLLSAVYLIVFTVRRVLA